MAKNKFQLQQDFEKTYYKMYKVGRTWIFATIVATTIGLTGIMVETKAQAEASESISQTISNDKISASSSSKTDKSTGNSSASSSNSTISIDAKTVTSNSERINKKVPTSTSVRSTTSSKTINTAVVKDSTSSANGISSESNVSASASSSMSKTNAKKTGTSASSVIVRAGNKSNIRDSENKFSDTKITIVNANAISESTNRSVSSSSNESKKAEMVQHSIIDEKAIDNISATSELSRTGQNTRPYFNYDGAIAKNIYQPDALNFLSEIAYGDGATYGNTGIGNTGTTNTYQDGNGILPNFVGADGTLKIYNQSKFMTNQMLQSAADYWNKLAGKILVVLVDDPAKSDETMQDSFTVQYDGNGNVVPVLGGQTYPNEWVNVDEKSADKYTDAGQGIVFYPNNWVISSFTPKELINYKIAVLIHELGHALGIPHLNGGATGNDGPYTGDDKNGVTSTQQQAAALALAGLTYRKPQKLATWIFTTKSATVSTDGFTIKSTIPWGLMMDYNGNYLNSSSQQEVYDYKTIVENYNVSEINLENIGSMTNGLSANAGFGGTTIGLGLINKSVLVSYMYTSNTGYKYYRFNYDGHDYIMNIAAFSN